MKRMVAAVLALCVLLCGCGVIRENNRPGAIVSTSVLDMGDNEDTGRVVTPAVYFLNGSSRTLTAEPRRLIVATGTNPAEVAVEALLEGPTGSSELTAVAPEGMTLEYIEYSRVVANVYLSYEGTPMDPQTQYILELAIANTVTDILGAEYICIFLNGLQAGFQGAPSAPLKKQSGNVDDAWRSASAKADASRAIFAAQDEALPETSVPEVSAPAQPAATAVELQTVLYYISADGGYLLPEVHTVEYPPDGGVQALIAELQKTPNNAALMKSPISEDVKLLDAALTDGEDGLTLSLNFSRRVDTNVQQSALSYAALIYTLTGFIPDVETVQISIGGVPLGAVDGVTGLSDGLQRSDFIGYIGSSAPLYFADKKSDLLIEVSRSMEQGETWSARARVLELLKGPLQGEGTSIWPVMPTGATEADIISVDVYGDTAYLNLSQHFKDACAGLSARSEMLLVYAMVNTVTAMDGVSKVQFLIEGRQTQTLAGTLCLADPFLKNYGLIKKSG